MDFVFNGLGDYIVSFSIIVHFINSNYVLDRLLQHRNVFNGKDSVEIVIAVILIEHSFNDCAAYGVSYISFDGDPVFHVDLI